MKEIWKDVPGHRYYQVSNLGQVRSLPRPNSTRSRKGKPFIRFFKGKILKPWNYNGTYRQVSLGRHVVQSVHSLVLLAFIGPCPDGMECRHLDGDPSNNRLGNLRWGTPQENWEDKRRHGTVNVLRGEDCPYSKLTEGVVREIRRRYRRYSRGDDSQVGLAKEFGLHQGTVSEIITRKIWRHI